MEVKIEMRMSRFVNKQLIFHLLFFCFSVCCVFAEYSQDDFTKFLNKIVTQAENQEKTVVNGKEGWLFFAPELRNLSIGKFWGDAAAKVSRSTKTEYADPFPAILDFKEQLDKVGIELIFVPVPAKAAIYPEMIFEQIPEDSDKIPRIELHHLEFYKILEENGIEVLDLTPIFLEYRKNNSEKLYCKQDTHWSGEACILTAEKIAERIRVREWLTDIPKKTYEVEKRKIEITGDLWRMYGNKELPKENLQLTFVREKTANGLSPVKTWRESPIVLLGDSHNLVLHIGGDMHAVGAGLADHLAHQLGFPVDLVASRGSGATPSRISLARRRDNMKGKRLVIWCISVREFTECHQGWRKVPVIR